MNGYSPFLRHFHDLKEVDGNTVLWVGLVRFAHLRNKYDLSHNKSKFDNSTLPPATIQHSTFKIQHCACATIQHSKLKTQHCAQFNIQHLKLNIALYTPHPSPQISRSALLLPPCAMPLLVSGIHTLPQQGKDECVVPRDTLLFVSHPVHPYP